MEKPFHNSGTSHPGVNYKRTEKLKTQRKTFHERFGKGSAVEIPPTTTTIKGKSSENFLRPLQEFEEVSDPQLSKG